MQLWQSGVAMLLLWGFPMGEGAANFQVERSENLGFSVPLHRNSQNQNYTKTLAISRFFHSQEPLHLAREATTTTGTLEPNDNTLTDENNDDNLYGFEGEAGESIAIELKSEDFDPYLVLLDSEGNAIAENDDGGEGQNAQIVITLTRTGFYQIQVKSYETGQGGNYTLSWREALPIDFQNAATKAEADSLLRNGIQQLDRSQLRDASETLQQALSRFRELGDRAREGATLSYLGEVSVNLGQYSQALDFFQQTLGIYRELEDRENEGKALNDLGLVYQSWGQYPQAIEFFQHALARFQELKKRSEEGTILNNLGQAYSNLGQYSQALDFSQQALFIHRETGNRAMEGRTLNNLGVVYRNWGQYPQAIEYFQQALALAREIGDRATKSGTLNNLGALYENLGQYPQAIEFYQQALALVRELERRAEEGTVLNNLGIVYSRLGQDTQALEFYQQALFIHREIGNRAQESTTLNNLGEIYQNREQYPRAIEFYQQALDLAREIGDRAIEGTTLNNLGFVYIELEEYPKAIEFSQQALFIHREIGNRAMEGTTLNNLGFIYHALKKYPQAEQYFLDAIAVYESLRSFDLSDADKIALFDTQFYPYRSLQHTFIAQNKIESALEISERGRARAFVDLLWQHFSNNAQSTPPLPTFADIQQVAQQQNATLVEYSLILEDLLYIWVISPTGDIAFRSVEISAIAGGLPLAELVNTARFSMGVRSRAIGIVPREAIEIVPEGGKLTSRETRLQQLHQLLIEPIADLLPQTPAERVIFVPHGELFLVPFPALQDANGTQLIDKHTLLTAPAIQVLQLAEKPNPPAPFPSREGGESPSPHREGVGEGSDRLVVGNPVMPSIFVNPGDPPVQLSSLPGAETEAKEIAQLLGTEPLIGNAATEPAVTARMQTSRIVHLATHGILDDAGGMGSSIALTPASRGNPPEIAPTDSDGFLTAQEILGLNLNADLVVLSACDTGRGKITGDGVVGLSRSLVTAGAQSVVVSLWKVPDDATAMLMSQFYGNLQRGLDKATALRRAMLSTRATHPAPGDWAAFTLIGETD